MFKFWNVKRDFMYFSLSFTYKGNTLRFVNNLFYTYYWTENMQCPLPSIASTTKHKLAYVWAIKIAMSQNGSIYKNFSISFTDVEVSCSQELHSIAHISDQQKRSENKIQNHMNDNCPVPQDSLFLAFLLSVSCFCPSSWTMHVSSLVLFLLRLELWGEFVFWTECREWCFVTSYFFIWCCFNLFAFTVYWIILNKKRLFVGCRGHFCHAKAPPTAALDAPRCASRSSSSSASL